MSKLPHIGKFVDSIREKHGMPTTELARRIEYHETSLGKVLKERPDLYIGMVWKMSIALKENILFELSKILAHDINTGKGSEVQEPIMPYENEAFKKKYIEREKEIEHLHKYTKALEQTINDKNEIISYQREQLKHLPVKNST